MVTTSSFFKATNTRQNLAAITVHMTNRVLHVPLRLVNVRKSFPKHIES